MMKLRISPVVFTLVYCVAYIAVLSMDAALFRYYPQTGEFSWGWIALTEAGPGMAWYGLMANAAIAAVLLGTIVPERSIAVSLRNFLWLFPAGAMAACVYLMKHFFLR